MKHHHRGGRGTPQGDGRDGRGTPRGDGRGGRRGPRAVWPPERRETAREAIEQLMRDRGLARRFEPAVEGAARSAAENPRVAVGSPARRDLRELATFTVDPASARDFDDAISAQRVPDGGVRVWVHIADVSAHVREGGAVDVEARERATSVYVPGAVEPMLPHALSSGACSLLPGHDRAAVTVEMELDLSPARVRSTAFYRSVIRSDERLDYEQVDEIFAGRGSARAPWGEPLAAAREVSAALARARLSHGAALTLESQEPEFEFDEHGEVSDIKSRVQTESHHLIEHLMIAANEAVARELATREVGCLYRVHEPPRAEAVQRLIEQLASLGVATPPVPPQLGPSQAAELVGEASRLVEAHVLRTVARARAGDRGASPAGGRQALTTLVLRALQQAYYSPSNLGHAGLGSPCYCHFTSPIRRYPDLVCHRALLSTLGGPERAPRVETLTELGEWTSMREREAMELERDGDDVARCFALERELLARGWDTEFPGEVVGVIGAGAFVAFGRSVEEELAEGECRYEGMLPVHRLARAMAERGGDPRAGEGGRRGEDAPPPARGGSRAQARGGSRAQAGGGSRAQAREWWELNEEGTILRGERSGTTLRLGDPLAVRVARIDTQRGRVDLDLALPQSEARASGVKRGGGAAGAQDSATRGKAARDRPRRRGPAR